MQGLELPASQAGVMLPPPTPRSCFLRGSHVRFMVLPDILKNAPFFKKIDTKASKARSGTGKAKAAAKERTVGARPHSPGPYYLPPGPGPQPASRRPPPARGVRARTRTQPATAFDAKPLDAACLAVPARVVRGLRGARVTPSPTAAQVGPRPASRLIEKLAAGAAPAGATRPSTEQTGSTMSRRSAVARPLYCLAVHTSQGWEGHWRGIKVWVKQQR